MKYLSVKEAAVKLQISERTVRKYCEEGKIEGAFLSGKSWFVPHNAKINKNPKRSCAEYGLAREMLDFIDASPVSYFVIENAKKMLVEHGYSRCYENKANEVKPGDKIYFKRNGTCLLAFNIGKNVRKDRLGYHIVISHCDSPSFKLKPNAEGKSDVYNKINVEPYGGMLCSTWLDRPLSAAGRVLVKEGNKIITRLVNIDEDLLMIPNMCIHYNRTANNGYAYNMATDMQPFYAESIEGGSFYKILAKAVGVEEGNILNFDMFLYNRQKGLIWGQNNEYLSSGRLDDQECVFTSLKAFLESENDDVINVLFIADNEEVGSESRQGADSDFLDVVTTMISRSLGLDNPLLARANSFMISADNGHAVHPNNPGMSDPSNRIYMNKGIGIKFNASQRYTSDGISSSLFQYLCDEEGVPYQFFTNRSDLRGGSTLGNIVLSHMSMYAVDVGLPQLAMHSSYETAGVKDVYYAYKAFKKFYSTDIRIKDSSFEIVDKQ